MAEVKRAEESQPVVPPRDKDTPQSFLALQQSHPREVAEDLIKVQKMLDADKPKDALHLLNRISSAAPPYENARAVCLMRMNKADEAVKLLRRLTLAKDGVWFRDNVPLVYKANLAVALALSGNPQGAKMVLREIGDQPEPQAERLRKCLQNWECGLSILQRVQWKLGVEMSSQIPVDFPPGELG